jgi:hypothetical protein
MVGHQSSGCGDLLSEPERGILDTAVGLGQGDVEERAFQRGPSDFVGLEHAPVDEQEAGPDVGAGGGAAEGVVEPLGGEVLRQMKREGARRRFAGILRRDAFSGLGAGTGGSLGVGPISGEAARGDGGLGGVAGHG